MRNQRTLLLGLVLAAAVGALGRFAFHRPCRRMPAVFNAHGQILVRAAVGGVEGWYVFDTASGRTLVTTAAATKLQARGDTAVTSSLTGSKAVRAIRVRSGAVQFASWRLRFPEEVFVLDLDPLAERLGHDVDGLLGWDVIREYVLGFDAHEQQFIGGKNVSANEVLAELGAKESVTAIPLAMVDDTPILLAQSGSQELKMILDTGCSQTILGPKAWDRLGGRALTDGVEKTFLTITGETSGQTATLDELRFGPFRWENLPILVKGAEASGEAGETLLAKADGILGMDVLAQRITIIDGPQRLLYVAGH